MIIEAEDISGLTDLKPRTIIGIGGKVFEVIPKTERGGQMVTFKDKNGKECHLFVRAVGKLPRLGAR